MSEALRIVVGISIHDGKLNEFKQVAEQMIALATENEPDSLHYDWYLAEDGRTCTVVEDYRNSDAFMSHVGNVGHLFEPLFETCQFSETYVYGNPSAEARGVADSLGTQVTS